MPVDENGNRCDLVIYGGSTMKRNNVGKAYEQFLNAASRDLVQRFRKEIGLEPLTDHSEAAVRSALSASGKADNQAQRLMGYYAITSPRMVDMLSDDPVSHLIEVLKNGIYLYFPPDNPVDGLDMTRQVKESEYCPHFGPVTYVSQVGDLVTTKARVLIGKLYFILLEKTTQEWSSVASVKLQYLGIPGRLNNNDKHGTPGREQSVRALGEAEVRGWLGAVDPEAVVELLDQSNNPIAHRATVRSILTDKKPTNIARTIDRKEIPFGGSRPVMLVNNFMSCLGVKFTHVDKGE